MTLKNEIRNLKPGIIYHFILALLLLTSSKLFALAPQEVLVVANEKSPESVELAEYYAAQRGIPKENIVRISTTVTHTVARDDYDSQIAAPIAAYAGIDKIRCICLMWGVPVRVSAGGQTDIMSFLNSTLKKNHKKLADDYKLFAQVGTSFHDIQSKEIEPVEKLFEKPTTTAPAKELPKIEDLRKEIPRLLASKSVQIKSLQDEKQRLIASRQLMGLYLDINGLSGLISYIKDYNPDGAPDIQQLQARLDESQKKLIQIQSQKPTLENTKEKLLLIKEIDGLNGVISFCQNQAKTFKSANADASVDSELSMLLWNKSFPPENFIKNPLFWKWANQFGSKSPRTLMACRIDGSTSSDAKKIIDESIQAEKTGLNGIFYIDAGGGSVLKPEAIKQYDLHLQKLYLFLQTNTKIKAVLDTQMPVFQKGSCPDAALYVGWYSLENYVSAFTWKPGAVGWHIASFEATKLRDPKTTQWCANMIKNGVAATIGAVAEPYLLSFPLPEEFFPLLLTGKYTVAECYWRTAPMTSWRLTLIADPLYNPFAANPQVAPDVLPSSLAP